MTAIDATAIDHPTSAIVDSPGYAYNQMQIPNYPATGGTGEVISVTVNTEGSGYSSPPNVIFSGGSGSGAEAVSVLGFGIQDAVIDHGGVYNSSAPTIIATVGTGATFSLTFATVSGNVGFLPGSGYKPSDIITLAGGTFTSAATFVVTTVQLTSASIVSGGSGYAINDTIKLGGEGTVYASPAIATVLGVDPGGVVNNLLYSPGGSYLQVAFTLTQIATSGSGKGLIINGPIWGAQQVNTIANGSYSVYPSNPVNVTGGSGAGATINVNWTLTNVAVTAAGQDYDSTSTWSTSYGSGSGHFILQPTGGVKRIDLVNGGMDYVTAPSVSFSGGGGSSAAATATLSSGGNVVIYEVSATFPTTNYTVNVIPNNGVIPAILDKQLDNFTFSLTGLNGASVPSGFVDILIDFTN